MTKEEAIKILPDMKGAGSEWDEAIDVAMDALKAQLPSAQPKQDREFMKLTFRNSNGRPYFSIIYLEFDDNGIGQDVEGYSSYSLDVISDYLKDYFMPSTQQWIPCSERLPEERDWYLGIFKEPDTGWINPLPFICDYLLGANTKATTKEGWILKGFTDREEYIDYYFNLECIAWMPLPKPYNEGDHE